MQKQEERKQVYEVVVVKVDHNHITVISTEKYDDAFEKWKKFTDIWTNAIKEKVPMIITDPVVTAFDPGLVKEITLRPLMEVLESKYDNPYQKQMMNKGLSPMLPGAPDLLDSGYR